MKKSFKIVAVLCIAIMSLFALVGCNANERIKKNFENVDYKVTATKITEDSDAYDTLVGLYGKEDAKDYIGYEWITVKKDGILNLLNSGTILAYPSASVLKEKLGDDYQDAVDAGLVNGNCYLIVYLSDDVKEVFNK